MPPLPFEYHGRDAAIGFFQTIVHPRSRPLRLVHTRANGCPATGVYAHDQATDTWRATGLVVVVMAGDQITELTRFEVGVMASFGLPRNLPWATKSAWRGRNPLQRMSSRHRE